MVDQLRATNNYIVFLGCCQGVRKPILSICNTSGGRRAMYVILMPTYRDQFFDIPPLLLRDNIYTPAQLQYLRTHVHYITYH